MCLQLSTTPEQCVPRLLSLKFLNLVFYWNFIYVICKRVYWHNTFLKCEYYFTRRRVEAKKSLFLPACRSTPRRDGFYGGQDNLLGAAGWEENGITTIWYVWSGHQTLVTLFMRNLFMTQSLRFITRVKLIRIRWNILGCWHLLG